MYVLGRLAKPSDRMKIFAAGLLLFAVGAATNGVLYNQLGVKIFILMLLIAKPLMDLAYFPIQFQVIDIVSKIEKRSEFAYILNHEAGLYVGRFLGAATFLVMAKYGSADIALRYAVVIIGALQLCSIFVGKKIIAQGKAIMPEEERTMQEPEVLGKVSEAIA
jgi:YQGE family putative transporter